MFQSSDKTNLRADEGADYFFPNSAAGGQPAGYFALPSRIAM